jgi:TonB family protein
MKRIELHIEHAYKNRIVGRHRLAAGEGVSVLGSSRDAHIRLLGDNVGLIHAALEWEDNRWLLSDLGSEFGTWMQKKPIVHHEITESTLIQIGHHQIKLTPITVVQELFAKDQTDVPKQPTQGLLFHQIVVRRNGLLMENSLINSHDTFSLVIAGKTLSLPPPRTEQWTKTDSDGIEIRQRLVRATVMAESKKEKLAQMFDPSLRLPLVLALLLLVFMTAGVFFLPEEPKDTLVALKPEEQNQYTRMIYDAAKAKKQKAENMKMIQHIAAKTDTKVTPKTTGNLNPSGAAARVVNNIKSSGLTALIGKISARASKNTVLIRAAGVAPDVAGAGVALGVGATVGSAAPKDVGAGVGSSQRLKGIGTAGKGGGSGDYKGFGGLANGNVGNASVGIVEDETEIEGGLDKDTIARYIKSQLGQIRYCYERQLSASPDLYGKVMVKFTIGASGTVTTQGISTTSLNNAMVEGCILRRVAGWQFPTPKGGTQVLVSYPFLFKSTR